VLDLQGRKQAAEEGSAASRRPGQLILEMTNDEIRMTKEFPNVQMTNDSGFGIESLVIASSLDIRHSSFCLTCAAAHQP
jgi:hypothetical protein